VPEILMAVTEERRQAMLDNVGKVWKRFMYSSVATLWNDIRQEQELKIRPRIPDLPTNIAAHLNTGLKDLSPLLRPDEAQRLPHKAADNSTPGIPYVPLPDLLEALNVDANVTNASHISSMLGDPDEVSYETGAINGQGFRDGAPQGTAAHELLAKSRGSFVVSQASDGAGNHAKTRVIGRLRATARGIGRSAGKADEGGETVEDVAEDRRDSTAYNSAVETPHDRPEIKEEGLIDWLDGLGNEMPDAHHGTGTGKSGRSRRARLHPGLLNAAEDAAELHSGRRGNRHQKHVAGEQVRHAGLPEEASGRELRERELRSEERYPQDERIPGQVGGLSGQAIMFDGDSRQGRTLKNVYAEHRQTQPPSLPGTYRGDLRSDDAFATILAWLYERIPQTRGPGP
jgi:hypothetical protein